MNMNDKGIKHLEEELKKIKELFTKEITMVDEVNKLTEIKGKYIGRKAGMLTDIIKQLPSLVAEERVKIGQEANKLKKEIEDAIEKLTEKISKKWLESKLEKERIDITLPAREVCKEGIRESSDQQWLICDKCHRKYPIKDDIPIMLIDEAVIDEKA